jgi:protoheme IX farnesyltransferase
MPPLIGWVAASGKLPFEAWILYAVLFLWQFPHFMAIAWMYREDYARAGYLVLPTDSDSRGCWVDFQTLLPLLILVLLNLFVALTGHSNAAYLIGASLLSAGFLYYGMQFVIRGSNSSARRLLAASIIYLPSLFVLMMLSRG